MVIVVKNKDGVGMRAINTSTEPAVILFTTDELVKIASMLAMKHDTLTSGPETDMAGPEDSDFKKWVASARRVVDGVARSTRVAQSVPPASAPRMLAPAEIPAEPAQSQSPAPVPPPAPIPVPDPAAAAIKPQEKPQASPVPRKFTPPSQPPGKSVVDAGVVGSPKQAKQLSDGELLEIFSQKKGQKNKEQENG